MNGDGYTVTIAMDDEVRLPTMEKDGNIPKMSFWYHPFKRGSKYDRRPTTTDDDTALACLTKRESITGYVPLC